MKQRIRAKVLSCWLELLKEGIQDQRRECAMNMHGVTDLKNGRHVEMSPFRAPLSRQMGIAKREREIYCNFVRKPYWPSINR